MGHADWKQSRVGGGRRAVDFRFDHKRHADLSASQLEALDQRVREMLEEARLQAASILLENRAVVEMLRDELVDKKVIEATTLTEMLNTDKKK